MHDDPAINGWAIFEDEIHGTHQDPEAASAGFYASAIGKQRAEHPDQQPDLNFKKAGRESNVQQKELI